jgi:hypothetical protein
MNEELRKRQEKARQKYRGKREIQQLKNNCGPRS